MNSQTKISRFDPDGPFAGLILPLRFRKRQSETRFKQEWRLTLAQYTALMREFIGPKRQRGSIILATSGAVGFGKVVLTAHNFVATTNGPCTSGVRFDRDGELHELDSVTGNVQQEGEWWSEEPAGGTGDGFAVRHLSSGKVGTYTNEAATANNWVTISALRIWDVDAPTDDQKACDATFEVGAEPSGPAQDSGFIELTAIDIGL